MPRQEYDDSERAGASRFLIGTPSPTAPGPSWSIPRHTPAGDLGFEELRAYFASLRDAFSDLRVVREQIIADGRFLAARNTFAGDFTYSPIGPVEPTGQHIEWEVINTFRYDDERRLAEEWVQTDYRSFLTKLGVTATESRRRGTNTR